MQLVSMSSFLPLLSLTPDKSPVEYKTHWKPVVEDHDTKSYSYYKPYNSGDSAAAFASVEQLDGWFQALHPSSYHNNQDGSNQAWSDAQYKGETLLRKTAWVVLDDQCTCEYGYSDTWQPISHSTQLRQVVQEITDAMKTVTGCETLNSCNLNYYPQGGGVGFHADDEFLFDGRRRPTCIISLSLCSRKSENNNKNWGARKFLVKPQRPGETEEETQDKYNDTDITELLLRHGDIMTMEGMFQNHYFHSVWPGDSKEFMDHPLVQGERINLTWRTIVQHLDGSDEECRGMKCPLSTTNNNI